MQDLVLRQAMIHQSNSPTEIKRIERAKLDALLGNCEPSSCRRQAILAHFGAVMAEPCGNCATFLAPVATWDGTIAAQKAMSAVLRTGERFGVGKEFSRPVWGSVFQQLIVQGAIEVDHDHFGALKLKSLAGQIRRGKTKIAFRRDQVTRTAMATVAKKTERIEHGRSNAQLFTMLKAERAYLAKTQNLAAYVIFTSETLAALAKARPHSLTELEPIPGMGTTKIDRYGMKVIDVVMAFDQPDDIGDSRE